MTDDNYVDNNLAKLQIFFKDIVYTDYTESPSYPVSFVPENKKLVF